MLKPLLLIALLASITVFAGCADDTEASNAANSSNNANTANSVNATNATNATNSTNVTNSETPTRAALLAKAEPYSRLVLEVDAVEGLEAEEIDARVETFIAALVDKPDGVEFVRDQTITGKGTDHAWTFEELQTLASETETLEVDENTIKIHVVFVDGSYENDSDDGVTLGLAWSTNIAMFGETITRTCDGPILQNRLCEFSEASILLHEVGHVLGLVDNGAPLTSDHIDGEHGKHCDNPECLMYWEYEGSSIIDALRGRLSSGEEELFQLDEACRQDLAAIE